jgi:DNA-binding transcriptional LysR family regulator
VATLDITCLRSLITVASLAGVRRAADALHLSQPTVTGHLRKLEAELGFPIVFRQGRSIAFTSQGEDLLHEAYALVEAHDAALARLGGAPHGEIVIASTEHASEQMLHGVGRILTARFPERPLRYEFHRTARLREFVHERAATVAIGFGDLGNGVEHVADVPLAWVGADRPNSADAASERLVAFARPCIFRERMLESTGNRFVIARECIDLASLLSAVSLGVGITVLPGRAHLRPGLRHLDSLPALTPAPLTFVTAPELDATVRSAIRRELSEVWAAR